MAPVTNNMVVVQFDTWLAYREGALAYRTSPNQWILTTGPLLESVVYIRDHTGGCLDQSTLTTLTWHYFDSKPTEPIKQKFANNACDMP